MWQLCLRGEQTRQSQKPISVYWGQYPSAAPGASAHVELIWRREVSGAEVERKREDFYRASKEVMQQMNLTTNLLENLTSMQQTGYYYGTEERCGRWYLRNINFQLLTELCLSLSWGWEQRSSSQNEKVVIKSRFIFWDLSSTGQGIQVHNISS